MCCDKRRPMDIGLRMVLNEAPCPDGDSNIVMKSGLGLLRLTRINSLNRAVFCSSNQIQFHCSTRRITSIPSYNCFLKSCFLCNHTLSLDKDVYMYRGDQGFCSEECRGRQIYIDEMKEVEISTRKTLAAIRARRRHESNCHERSNLSAESYELRSSRCTAPAKNRANDRLLNATSIWC